MSTQCNITKGNRRVTVRADIRKLAYELASHFNGIYCDDNGLQLLTDALRAEGERVRREALEEAAHLAAWGDIHKVIIHSDVGNVRASDIEAHARALIYSAIRALAAQEGAEK